MTSQLRGAWQSGFVEVECPFGQTGDRLWVRETWVPKLCIVHDGGVEPIHAACECGGVYYRADEPDDGDDVRWKPSIHMPRRASRITLEITDVRVERLNEISEEDAKAEGANPYDPTAYFSSAACALSRLLHHRELPLVRRILMR